MDLEHAEYDYILTDSSLEECFLYSMMTVTDELNKMKKYTYLVYVEFLEFLCRVAIVGLDFEDMVEYKVHTLLELVYEKLYASGELDKEDFKLAYVDESYNHNTTI